jgi:hypothetical protein
VEAPAIVRACGNKINDTNDSNDGIISMTTIPQANNQNLLIDTYNNNDDSSNIDLLQGGNPCPWTQGLATSQNLEWPTLNLL